MTTIARLWLIKGEGEKETYRCSTISTGTSGAGGGTFSISPMSSSFRRGDVSRRCSNPLQLFFPCDIRKPLRSGKEG